MKNTLQTPSIIILMKKHRLILKGKSIVLINKTLRLTLLFPNFYNLFDLEFYNLQVNKKFRIKINAIIHFLFYGNKFGLDISPLVDSDWIHFQYVGNLTNKKKFLFLKTRKICTLRYFSFGYRNGITANIFNKKFAESPDRNIYFFLSEQLMRSRGVNVLKKKSVDFSNYFGSLSKGGEQYVKKSYLLAIPSYGNYHLLKICLRMINSTIPNLKIVVINDGYSEEIPIYFKNKYPNIDFIENKKNVGFLRAVNTLYAKIRNFDYLILINTDTFLENNFLHKIDKAVSEDKDIGILGLRSIALNGTILEHGGVVAKDGTAKWNQSGLDVDLELARKNIKSQYVSGNSMVIRTDLLMKRNHIFDDRYAPAYYEDTDLCFYVRENELKVVASGEISCIHLVSQTYSYLEANLIRTNDLLMNTNKIIFQKKWKEFLIKDFKKVKDKTIWWIDDQYFFENRDSGSYRNYLLTKVLLHSDYKINLISTKIASDVTDIQKTDLYKYGIEYFTSVSRAIEAANQFSWLEPSLIIISRWDNYVQYAELIRTIFPDVKIFYDMQDMHGVRINLEEKIGLRDRDGLGTRISKIEEKCALDADLTIFISNPEKNKMQDIKKSAVIPVPEIIGNSDLNKNYSKRRDILFFANFYHTPNLDGLRYFLETVWIDFKKNDQISKFHIAGYGIHRTIKDELLKYQDIKVLGHVENLDNIISNYLCTVAPLRYGAGIKGKVIKSIAQYTPVLGSEHAFEGINFDNSLSWCVSRSKDEYHEKLEKLANDKNLWQSVSESGVALLRKEFDLNLIQQRFLNVIHDRI